MKQRVITATFILAALIPFLWFSETVEYPIVITLLTLIGVFEMLRVFGVQKNLVLSLPAYLLSALPLFAYLYPCVWGKTPRDFIFLAFAALTVYLLYLLMVAVLAQGDVPFDEVGRIFSSVFYIVSSFSALTLVRYLGYEQGLFYVLPVFIAAWLCDVFAYFTGFLIGRHKLIPRVSPKKTVEGSVGGIVFATAGLLLYGFILSRTAGFTPNYWVLGASGVILSVVSQIGDLSMSLIKREHGVKDYGKIFPGHGGVLDRFDSIMAVSAVWTLICLIVNPFM